MSWKKFFIFFIVTIVVGTIVFLIINNFYGTEPKNIESNSNVASNEVSNETSNNQVEEKEIEKIDFGKYQELRSEMYDDKDFAIIILKSDDTVCSNFRKEVLSSFNDLKTDLYEIYVDELDDVSSSSVISDITDIMEYEEPSLITPTLIVSKKGKIVYAQDGFVYSHEIVSNLKENGIE